MILWTENNNKINHQSWPVVRKEVSYSTVSSTYHIWLCSIEKQEEIEKLTQEKEGKH